jgi:hypothetical protein
MFRTIALSVVFCVFSYVTAHADFDLTVTVDNANKGTVTSNVLNLTAGGTGSINTTTSQFLGGINNSQSTVTLTAIGVGPTAVTSNYTITEGNSLSLSASSSTPGTKFKHWLDNNAPPFPSGNDISLGSPKSFSLFAGRSITGVFEDRALSELSFTWTIGSLTPFTTTSADTTVSWATIAGLSFGTPIASSLKVEVGSQSSTANFDLTINPLGGGSAAVPEPSSLLLLASTGLVVGSSSRRMRERLAKMLGRRKS